MKDVLSNEVSKYTTKKIFTKEAKNTIINKKYNPLKVNYKLIYEREGLYVKKTKDVLLKEINKELNWKEKIVIKIFKKTFCKVHNLIRISIVNKLLK